MTLFLFVYISIFMIPLFKPYINKEIFTQQMSELLLLNKFSYSGLQQEKTISLLSNIGYEKENLYLVNSCTDALELSVLLSKINDSDRILVQSFTFSSSLLPFLNTKAEIIFLDSIAENIPYVSLDEIKKNYTEKVRVIVLNHYAGISTPEIDLIADFAKQKNIILIEDNAHGLGAKYKNKVLGTFGDFGTISFHDTKNISSGEGGLLISQRNKESINIKINKGTNFNTQEAKNNGYYELVGKGSSFGISEINCALLNTQLLEFSKIQEKRIEKWNFYYNFFKDKIKKEYLPFITKNCEHNAGFFYLFAKDIKHRDAIIKNSKNNNFTASFHYFPLHKSKLGQAIAKKECPNANLNYEKIYRLPLFYEMTVKEQIFICNKILELYNE